MIPLMNVERQAKSLGDSLTRRVTETVLSGQYILGNEVKQFERDFAEYCERKYAIGVASGTDAITIALKALGIGYGDEVITSAMSFFATPEAISNVGATPVFVDCTRDTFTIDVEKIESKITKNTKAIIPVHIYGQCADMDRINEIARKYELFVVEDCAQAAGATYKTHKACGMGDVSCVSFFPTKNLGGAGDGGIILTNSEDIYKKCRAFRAHGSGVDGQYTYNSFIATKDEVDEKSNPTKYDNYVIGFNSRLDEIQATILNIKLPYLNSWNSKRNIIASKYNSGIKNDLVVKPKVQNGNYHVYYVYVVLVEDQNSFRKYLEDKGVSTGVYFPIPLHLQKPFEKLGYKEGEFPNAEYVSKHSVAIPMFPELTDHEVEYIIECINDYNR